MARPRAQGEDSEGPVRSLEDHWWEYLRDLGRYDLGEGWPSKGRAAVSEEWARLDGTDMSISERVERLIKFCTSLGATAWAVRARTEVGRASARQQAAKNVNKGPSHE